MSRLRMTNEQRLKYLVDTEQEYLESAIARKNHAEYGPMWTEAYKNTRRARINLEKRMNSEKKAISNKSNTKRTRSSKSKFTKVQKLEYYKKRVNDMKLSVRQRNKARSMVKKLS